jgi:alkanesulfonate monooxygenase SsuD/methylene tetrahydromethanopterin reductase-like flavin-dependent oxidoreductase (luciferase family)
MIAGRGARMLSLAGREADIVGFPLDAGVKPHTEPERALAERVALVRREAGERADDLELNLLIAGVAVTPDEPDLPALRPFLPGLGDAQLLRLPNVLVGSERQIAEKLRHYREAYGISYFSVVEPHMAAFARVMPHLR